MDPLVAFARQCPQLIHQFEIIVLESKISLHDSANRGTSGYMGTILWEDDPKFVGVLAMG